MKWCVLAFVLEPTIIEKHLSSKPTVIVREGDTVELVCNATGVPHPTVNWFRIPTGLIHADESDLGKKRENFCQNIHIFYF